MRFITLGILIGLSILSLLLYKKLRDKIFKFDSITDNLHKKIADILDKVFFFVFLFAPIAIAILIIGLFGAIERVDCTYSNNNILWCVEHGINIGDEMGSEYPDTFIIRAVDMENGKVNFRKVARDEFVFYGWSDGLGWYQAYKGIITFKTGKSIFALDDEGTIASHITEKKLNKIPELSMGIASFDLNPETFLLEVRAKDGVDYIFDPITLDIASEDQKRSALERSTNNDEDDSNEKPQRFYLTNDVRSQLVNENKELVNDTLFFLHGELLQVSDPLQKIIIMSYETTDKKRFILHCLSFDGQVEWTLRHKDLGLNNVINMILSSTTTPVNSVDHSVLYKENLIIVAGGYVLSLKLATGDIVWKARL